MKKYTTLFLDMDNTILDFSASERYAIRQLFVNYGLPCGDKAVKAYSRINDSYWKKFERGELEKSEIVIARFKDTLALFGEERDFARMNDDYFQLLSQCYFKTDGAIEVLSYLKSAGYLLYATTNGVSRTQHNRISGAGIKDFFNGIFVSEDAGFQKPDKRYFDYVIKNCDEKDTSKILVIGDSMTSDIKGGINTGLDTCWYNGHGEAKLFEPTYEITDIRDLENIL